jgi:hypothetical protein
LSTVDKNISFRALVDLAKMRWRVERDYERKTLFVPSRHVIVRQACFGSVRAKLLALIRFRTHSWVGNRWDRELLHR